MTNRKPLWTALAIVLVVIMAFSLPTVRAWASDFLSLFRVQKITVLEMDPLAMKQAEQDMVTYQDMLEGVFDKNLKHTGGGDLAPVASVEEAAALAGFIPRLPAQMQDLQLAVQPGDNVELTIDQEQMQALLAAFESDVQIPAELDGQVIYFSVQAGVVASSGCAPEPQPAVDEDCVRLYQLPAPSVTAPAGLDVQALGESMLKAFGMSDQEIRAFSDNVDWTSTLIIPIPRDSRIQYTELNVDGVTGTFIKAQTGPESGEKNSMLLWVKNGMLYALEGPASAAEAQALVESMP